MSAADPGDYVVSAADSTTWSTGAGAISTLDTLGQALGSGDWCEAGLFGLAGTADVAATLVDPFGALLRWGISWVIEHLEPLPTLLDQLTGDPDAVIAVAGTWHNVAAGLGGTADAFGADAARATQGWEGLAATAYGTYATARSLAIRACATSATGIAGAMQLASSVVAGVRAVVRDEIAGLMSWIAGKVAILFTGIGTGPVLYAMANRVRNAVGRLQQLFDGLSTSVVRLADRIDEVLAAMGEVNTVLRRVAQAVDLGADVTRVVVAPTTRAQQVASASARHAVSGEVASTA